MVNQAAKGESKSPILKQMINSVNSQNSSNGPGKLIRKIMIKTLGERAFSAQETMHHLLSIKLHSSSFSVIPISLEGSRKLKNKITDGRQTNDSNLDYYANKEHLFGKDLENINFVQFVTKYCVVSEKLEKQSTNFIPRLFPTYSPNPHGPNFDKYCKFQLLRYKPWKINKNTAWDNREETDSNFINSWKQFLETPYAENNVPNWSDKVLELEQQNEATDSDRNEEDITIDHSDREEWMILSDLTRAFEGNESTSLDTSMYNWSQDSSNYTLQQIQEMPSWIAQQKEYYNSQWNIQYDNIDISTFSVMQDKAYTMIKNHFELPSPKTPPF